MQTPLPPDISSTTNPDVPRGIAEDYAAQTHLPDEMIDSDGTIRPHWRKFVSILDGLGSHELRLRWDHARRLIHENGVTHNVYGDPHGLDRPWGLDLIPLLMPALEWQKVCDGLVQRARLLDALIADLYGPARAVREGLLPPELVWANCGFLRACHGITLPENRWLHLYAADLVKTEDGQYEVLSDRTQAPSGAGYSLENRIVLSQTLPGAFRQCNVERLAPFFAALRDTLSSLAPANQDNPRIVLLTPGPLNETYFEQTFLAKYLGYALVQGNDLTVRDGHVYLKTVGKLQKVDVILRRVDDDYCDPLELYAASYLGVPGLVQAVRQRNVTVANALGTGLLQAPGFLPFLPELCRQLLGERLQLPSVPTWWCGQPKELQFVLEHLEQMVIKPAYPTRGEDPVFGQELSKEHLSELAHKIKAHPEKYVAQNQLMSCTTPALIDDHIQPRRFVIRPYLAAHRGSYTAMEGALTRITPSKDSLVVSMQRGGGSKDTWILSEGTVSQMTLLQAPAAPIALRRGVGDLPSRNAEDLFWLGRYLERVGTEVRLARAALQRMTSKNDDDNHAGRILAEALEGDEAAPREPGNVSEFIEEVMGDDKKGGLQGIVTQTHRLTKVLRDRLPPDAWSITEQLYETVSTYEIDPEHPAADWARLLDSIIVSVAALLGLADDSMMSSRSWRFLGMGRRIERTIFTADLLEHTFGSDGNDPVLLQAVIEIAESAFAYRRRYLARLEAPAIVDLMVADESNPRAIAFQLARISRHLAELPRDPMHPNGDRDQQLMRELREFIQSANLVELCGPAEDGTRKPLIAFLASISERTAKLSEAIAQLYFTHAAISRNLGQIGEEPAPGKEAEA
jgi:uncharacterized circularly permuted ATP-grasp superfamily protein/uncharacterized alpha-E superfamily protein